MNAVLDRTHDAAARSWVPSARDPGTPFPLQNLPFGVFRRRGSGEMPRAAVAIGGEVLALEPLITIGLLDGLGDDLLTAAAAPDLRPLMALGRAAARALRHRLFDLLVEGSAHAGRVEAALVRMADAELLLPATPGDYTDFYASVHHATNVGTMLRPDQPLMPNYKWVPIGYHGRASSVVVSGTEVRRPVGQVLEEGESAPGVRPSRLLDYECEAGAWIAGENRLGDAVPLREAEERIFGLSLVNDWSARDVQRWEYQPLGPFLSKSFATSVSPWVVTLDALAPYRAPRAARPAGDPLPLPYLDDPGDREAGAIAVELEVYLRSERMRADGIEPARLSRSRLADLYWTFGQLVTHHASNGCNLRPGDLLASGTVSGPERDNRGCLFELSWRGTEPVSLPGGETRRFLADGDEVILRGTCRREGFVPIGLGECRGVVLPAHAEGRP
ncbi:MAG TPA: fumarylacetoacetase [Gemmatimonadales bacterium]|nr:fumarylacetoacetase [Gemmatimonadales bacterium]